MVRKTNKYRWRLRPVRFKHFDRMREIERMMLYGPSPFNTLISGLHPVSQGLANVSRSLILSQESARPGGTTCSEGEGGTTNPPHISKDPVMNNPCPWCGGRDVIPFIEYREHQSPPTVGARCQSCKAERHVPYEQTIIRDGIVSRQLPDEELERIAIQLWNERPT